MKINSISLISVLSTLSIMSVANASVVAEFYAGGMVGAGGQTLFTSDKHDSKTSRLVGAIIGVDIPVFRIEGEYNYIDSDYLDTNSVMLNAYLKVPSTVIMPYIGAGIGTVFGGKHEITDTDTGIKTNYTINSTAAYQGMLGATIDILAIPIKFDVEGRVLYAPDIYKIEAINASPDLMEYNARIKMRYIF
ncbi:MAG: outer membrane beta-barrel protein [Alphaproteobacteria bacterium]|nr:outer membrane beta-barrel protein [Alphaproteobacteria bacterium]